MTGIEKRPLIGLDEILDLALKPKIRKLHSDEFVAARLHETRVKWRQQSVMGLTYAHITGDTVPCQPGEGTNGPRPVLVLLNLAGSSSSLYLYTFYSRAERRTNKACASLSRIYWGCYVDEFDNSLIERLALQRSVTTQGIRRTRGTV